MIHHYTSIQTLALILESKKIRFTRIDLLDDIKEPEGIPARFKQMAFVSCWSEDKLENLQLWNLYTQMKGVRISLPQDMFGKYLIKARDYGNWGYGFDVVTPLPLKKIRNDMYLIINPFWLNDGFYKKVIYSDSYVEDRKELCTSSGNGYINIRAIQNLFTFKDTIWSFQNESRFYLIVLPLPPLSLYKDRETQMLNCNIIFPEQNQLPEYIDVDLNINVLNNIVVRLNPICTYSDKIIIRSLLDKYTTNGVIEESTFRDTYRGKQQ